MRLEIGACKDEPSHYNLRSAADYVSDLDFVSKYHRYYQSL